MTPWRAVLSWLVLLVVAFVNGAVRQFAYPASLGEFAAHQISAVTAALAFGVAIWILLRRWPIASARNAWATGLLWLGLTVVAELALVLGGGEPWSAVVDQYAIWRGSLWPVLLAWVAVAPRVLSALQRRRGGRQPVRAASPRSPR